MQEAQELRRGRGGKCSVLDIRNLKASPGRAFSLKASSGRRRRKGSQNEQILLLTMIKGPDAYADELTDEGYDVSCGDGSADGVHQRERRSLVMDMKFGKSTASICFRYPNDFDPAGHSLHAYPSSDHRKSLLPTAACSRAQTSAI